MLKQALQPLLQAGGLRQGLVPLQRQVEQSDVLQGCMLQVMARPLIS